MTEQAEPFIEDLIAGDAAMERVEERRLRSDVLLMLTTKFGGLLLNVVSSIVVARALGVEGRGTVAVALSVTMLLVQFGSFGLTTANPYFVGQDPSLRGRIVSNSLVLAAGLGGVLVGAGFVLKVVAPDVVRGLDWTVLTLALAAVPLMLAVHFLQSVLLGQARSLAYNLTELLLSVSSVVALVLVLEVANGGVRAALAVTVANQAVATVVYVIVLMNRGWNMPRPDGALAREMLRYATRVYVATLIAYAVIRIDMLMVNGYLGEHAVGLYSVAVALADGLYLVPAVVAVNLFARVARGLGSDASAAVFRSVAVLYGILCGVSVVCASVAIRLLYGSAYAGAIHLYYWLAPGVFFLGLITILSQHFAGRGFPREAMLVWFPALGLNVAINVLFLRRYGTYIASLASSVAYGLLLLLHMRLFAREMGGWRSMRPRPNEVVRFVRVALSRDS